jgi:hypothetical protein
MTTLLLTFFSLLSITLLAGLFYWSWQKNNLLRTIVLGATLIHELLLVFYPVIYSIINNYYYEDAMMAMVVPNDLLKVMIGETCFIIFFALSLTISWTPFRILNVSKAACIKSIDVENKLVKFLVFIGCFIYVYIAFIPDGAELQNSGFGWGKIFYVFKSIFWYMPLVACSFIVTKKNILKDHLILGIFAAIPLIMLLVVGFGSGVRGRVIWVISLLIIAGVYNKQRKVMAMGAIMSIVFIPFFAILGNSDIRDSRDSINQFEVVGKAFSIAKDNLVDLGDAADIFLSSFASRAQGVRNSVALYQNFDQGGGGFSTYLGSIFLPIPRVIWEAKPISDSLNNSELESAMYKVMDLSYGATGQMGPFLASAHAYWEGGWIWLIIAGFLTGLIWNSLFICCRRMSDNMAAIVILSFSASHMVDGLLTMMSPIYSYIDLIWLSIVPLYVAYKIISLLNFFYGKRILNGI